MRQFNFEEFKRMLNAGEPLEIITRDGREVTKIIEIKHRISKTQTETQLLIIIEDHEEGCGIFNMTRRCGLNGLHITGDEEDDLFFKPQERIKYAIIHDSGALFTDTLFDSEEEAKINIKRYIEAYGDNMSNPTLIVGTVKFKI